MGREIGKCDPKTNPSFKKHVWLVKNAPIPHPHSHTPHLTHLDISNHNVSQVWRSVCLVLIEWLTWHMCPSCEMEVELLFRHSLGWHLTPFVLQTPLPLKCLGSSVYWTPSLFLIGFLPLSPLFCVMEKGCPPKVTWKRIHRKQACGTLNLWKCLI